MVKKKSVRKVAKKGAVKKSIAKPVSMNKKCTCKHNWASVLFVKLGAMAFILFVITIWPAAMDLVHSINAWWFLLAAIVLYVLHMLIGKCCS